MEKISGREVREQFVNLSERRYGKGTVSKGALVVSSGFDDKSRS